MFAMKARINQVIKHQCRFGGPEVSGVVEFMVESLMALF
jgi:hypothetical protein